MSERMIRAGGPAPLAAPPAEATGDGRFPASLPGAPVGVLGLILLIALILRAAAAVALELFARQRRELDVFGDSAIYWHLADCLRTGGRYVVSQWGVPHYALRTPGYPAFLAVCQRWLGPDESLGVRLAQAALGTVGVWAGFRLVATIRGIRAGRALDAGTACWLAPILTAAMLAVEPYTVGMSALLLSEAVFIPLMILNLWGLAALWSPRGGGSGCRPGLGRTVALAVATGLVGGAAVLVRPSWALGLPMLLLAWVAFERSGRSILAAALVAASVAGVMAPWWARNERIFDRFVPTALWVGASLYDGISPTATGASDMRFLEAPDVRDLGEWDQDAELRRRAMAFARSNPRRVLELAGIKAKRFFSPWPNADELSQPALGWGSAAVTLPIYVLVFVGAWDRRRDARALVLLLGPLLSFLALHLIFVSSIRYRVPGAVPAIGLAAIGLTRLMGGGADRRWGGRDPGRRGFYRLLGWVLALPMAVTGGGGWYAYTYVTNSSTLTALIEQGAKRFLPGSVVSMRRATLRPLIGEVTLAQVRVNQLLPELLQPTVDVAWLKVNFDLWAMLRGEHRIRKVALAQPTLRIARLPDGRWNLETLLADPFPMPQPEVPPQLEIQNGTVQLVEAGGATSILREVSGILEPIDGASHTLRFDLKATGDGFARMQLKGTLHLPTRRIEIESGEVGGLEVSETLGERLPGEWRSAYHRLGLNGSLADVSLNRLIYDGSSSPALRYDVGIEVRGGTWKCADLPLPLNIVKVSARVADGIVSLRTFEGTNGRTTVTANGTLAAGDPVEGPLALSINVFDLELDARLKEKTPVAWAGFWDQFQPGGTIDAFARIVREQRGAAPGVGLTVDCDDVRLTVRDWPYPLEHVRGRLNWENGVLEIDRLTTLIGNAPATCSGTVTNPGIDAHVLLNFEVASLPIDEPLYRSLPPDTVRVIQQFRPTGRVRLREGVLERTPPDAEHRDGKVDLRATLDLGEPFAFEWQGLPYPVTGVSGELKLAPGRWELRDLKGRNNLAEIEGDGWVEQDAANPQIFNAELALRARNLPFDDQLKQSLPAEWQATWGILNPSGTTALDAKIRVKQNHQRHILTIAPEEDTQVRLKFQPVATERDPKPKRLELPAMEQVRGTFVYDDGEVAMSDVRFQFRGSPIRFKGGTVIVRDTGQFALVVDGLEVKHFRIDAEMRRLMPPVMADFARRLDESPALPSIRGNLRLGWSGRPGEPAWVGWDDGLVIFNGQRIRTGVELNALQGRFAGVEGHFDGRVFTMDGLLDLDSIHVLGQQVIGLRTPVKVDGESARLERIEAELLGGKLTGRVGVGLQTTPSYEASLAIAEADLARFTKTMPGRQELAGLLSGQFHLDGVGTDLRTMRGEGEFKIRDGALGELPVFLSLFSFLNLAPPTKTAFDSADVQVTLEKGTASLDPIALSGNAFSLRGGGDMDLRGNLDLRLQVLYGRAGRGVPLLSPVMREATGQFFDLRVQGTVGAPQFRSELLPTAGNLFRRIRPGSQPRRPDSGRIFEGFGARFGLGTARGER